MIKTTHIRLGMVGLCVLVLSGCSVFSSEHPLEIVFDTPQEEVEAGVRLALHADDWDGYGEAVDVRGDVLVVGASEWNYYGAGKAYVYRFSDGAWHEEAQLVAHDGGEQSWRFGASVAVGEGIIAIGAPGSEDPQAAVDSGAVYLFEYDGQTWVETAKLTPNPIDRTDIESRTGWQTDFRRVRTFGALVALDGDTLAVAGATETESVYMFQRTEDGWQEQAHLAVPAIPERDLHVVSLSLFGDTLALSAFYTPPHSRSQLVRSQLVQGSVAVYLFEREGEVWQESFQFVPEGEADFVFLRNKMVGASVTLGGPPDQANLFAVGLPGFPDWRGVVLESPETPAYPESKHETGAVYIFERSAGG